MKPKQIVRVRDVMRSGIDIIDGMKTIAEALAEMQHTDNKMLIVDKRHADDEYGEVRMSDIADHVLAQDKSVDRINVYEIMNKPALTIDAAMDMRYCARLLRRFNLSRAAVVDDGKLVGVVSLSSMVLLGLKK